MNCKAAFVAGVVLTMSSIHDIVGMVITIPEIISLLEGFLVLILIYFSLAKNKMDGILLSQNIEMFGSYMTVMSLVEYMLVKILKAYSDGVDFEVNLLNSRFFSVVLLSVITGAIIICSLWLLFNKSERKEKIKR